MAVKKLTGKQLLEIIEENYDVSSFGFNEMTEAGVELTAEETAEGERLQSEKKEYWESIQDEIGELQWSERQHNESFKKHQNMPSEWDYKRDCITNRLGLGKVVEVEQVGGEDEGSTWYSVKHFVDHDVYIRTDGYYQSYNGTDFHNGHGRVVTPKKKTITVFS